MARRIDPSRILVGVRRRDRSAMITQMFESADRLGIDRGRIRSKSEGYEVPREIAVDLFPSLYPEG